MSADGLHNARDHGLAGDGETNDQPALAALVNELGDACARDGRGRVIYCPPGDYSIRDAGTVWRSGVSLLGAGAGATRFILSNPGRPDAPVPLAFFTTAQHGADREHHIADITFASFEIDGSRMTLAEYDVLAKGLGLQYVLRGRFRDLYIHDTPATGFGCDFLQDTVLQGVTTVNCGRLDTGEQMGGAGIGIGIGGWGLSERTTITACTAIGSGTNGIFVELQKEYWPPPRGIHITNCHAEANRFGISDWGADGLIVTACTIVGNQHAGFDVSSLGTSAVGGRGGILSGCVIDRNVRDGVAIGNSPGPYTLHANRISHNGRYGYRQYNQPRGSQEPARDIVLDGNEIYGNALDGVRVDVDTLDAALIHNRVRANGRRAAPAATGSGPTVRYGEMSVTDEGASWLPDGHLGKTVTVGERSAVVIANTETELFLAPCRPGVTSAWDGDVPAPGAPYRLPDTVATRAGIVLAATAESPTIRGNRAWDGETRKTQTHGVRITDTGECVDGRVDDNDFDGNAVAPARFD